MQLTKKQKGQQYRQHALELLARLGYATSRQLTFTLHGSTEPSKRKMTGRTMRWLEEAGLVVSKKQKLMGLNSVNAEMIYALSKQGASAARDMGSPLVAEKTHARDFLRHEHLHRTMCNSVFCALQGTAYSEIEVRAGEAPLASVEVDSTDFGKFKKIPDLIARDTSGDLIWIEVENAYRSAVDLEKMIAALRTMYEYRRHYGLSHVLFVITNEGAKNIGKRLKERLLHEQETGASVVLKNFDKALLENFVQVALLVPETMGLNPRLL